MKRWALFSYLMFLAALSAAAFQTFQSDAVADSIERWDSGTDSFTTLVDLDAAFGTSNYGPQGLALSTSDIYWVDSLTDALYSSGINGSNPMQLNTMATAFQNIPNNTNTFIPRDIAVSGSTLHIADAGQAKILQIDTSGSTASATVAVDIVGNFGGSASDYNPTSLLVDGSAIFWTDERTEKIYKSDAMGTNEIVDMTSSFGSANYVMTGLAAHSGNLYWTDSASTDDIYTSDFNGNGLTRLYDPAVDFPGNAPEPTSLGIVGSSIIFSSQNDGLFTVDLNGMNAQKLNQGPSERYVVFVPEPAHYASLVSLLALAALVGRRRCR